MTKKQKSRLCLACDGEGGETPSSKRKAEAQSIMQGLLGQGKDSRLQYRSDITNLYIFLSLPGGRVTNEWGLKCQDQ